MISLRTLAPVALAVFFLVHPRPADASSISLLVGDKDGFGLGLKPGDQLPCVNSQVVPCLSPIQDWRTTELGATNGAQLTDVYSALYDGVEFDCPNGCSPNGSTGFVRFSLGGQLLTSGSITMFMGDFESTEFGAMSVNVNGVPINFFYDQGYRNTGLATITLTSAMIAAANLDGELRLFFDHRAFYDSQNPANSWGSFDYVAFDYFELNADAVPEPGTWLLLGTGLAALAARFKVHRSRFKVQNPES